MMKVKSFFSALFLCGIMYSAYAQIAPEKYWVQFTDKNNSPYSINNPGEFLSERALERRNKYNIDIDELDIPVNDTYIQGVEQTGAVILNPSKWLNGVTIQTNDINVINAINALPYVENTMKFIDGEVKQVIKEDIENIFYDIPVNNEELDDYYEYALHKKKNYKEKKLANIKKLDDYYGYALPQIQQLNGINLHEANYRGEGMLIGICDGGFMGADSHAVFEEIRKENRLLGTRNFVNKGTTVYESSSHGTSVWSLIGGNIPNTYVGTAPKASFYLCLTEDARTENLIEEYNFVSALELLDSIGVDVINSSLGYIQFDMPQWSHSYSDMDGETCIITIGAEIASSKGIIVVNSAGNDGASWTYPYIGAPADGEHVFTIGAVDVNGELAYFSSIGPSYDGRIKPDVVAHGENVTVASPDGSFYNGSGTSYSTPVMTGMLTCLWQIRPDLEPETLKEIIRESANRTNNPDNYYGYGIPDFTLAMQTLSVDEVNETIPIINVYPNPSNGVVNVEFLDDDIYGVQVYNQLGVLIYADDCSGDSARLQNFLTTLGSGMYFVNVMSSSNNNSLKVVKY